VLANILEFLTQKTKNKNKIKRRNLDARAQGPKTDTILG